MTKDEALQLALEALTDFDYDKRMKAIEAIKEALEKKDEPVAWGVFEGNLHDMFFTKEEAQEMAKLKGSHAEIRPLYTTPQRTWVGLTDDEIWKTISRIGTSDSDVNPYAKLADARAIEAKLKEKNFD